LDHSKSHQILQEFREGVYGGHFAPAVAAHRIIIAIYYWPNMFRDVYAMIRKFLSCQKKS